MILITLPLTIIVIPIYHLKKSITFFLIINILALIHIAILIIPNTIPITHISFPTTYIPRPRSKIKRSFTITLIIYKLALIHSAIMILDISIAMTFAIDPIATILSTIRWDVSTHSTLNIIFPHTLIFITIWVCHCTMALLLLTNAISLKFVSVRIL